MNYIDLEHKKFIDPVSGKSCHCSVCSIYNCVTKCYFMHFEGIQENYVFSLIGLDDMEKRQLFCMEMGAKTTKRTIGVRVTDAHNRYIEVPPLIAFTDIGDLHKICDVLNQKLTEKFYKDKDITSNINLRFK